MQINLRLCCFNGTSSSQLSDSDDDEDDGPANRLFSTTLVCPVDVDGCARSPCSLSEANTEDKDNESKKTRGDDDGMNQEAKRDRGTTEHTDKVEESVRSVDNRIHEMIEKLREMEAESFEMKRDVRDGTQENITSISKHSERIRIMYQELICSGNIFKGESDKLETHTHHVEGLKTLKVDKSTEADIKPKQDSKEIQVNIKNTTETSSSTGTNPSEPPSLGHSDTDTVSSSDSSLEARPQKKPKRPRNN